MKGMKYYSRVTQVCNAATVCTIHPRGPIRCNPDIRARHRAVVGVPAVTENLDKIAIGRREVVVECLAARRWELWAAARVAKRLWLMTCDVRRWTNMELSVCQRLKQSERTRRHANCYESSSIYSSPNGRLERPPSDGDFWRLSHATVGPHPCVSRYVRRDSDLTDMSLQRLFCWTNICLRPVQNSSDISILRK